MDSKGSAMSYKSKFDGIPTNFDKVKPGPITSERSKTDRVGRLLDEIKDIRKSGIIRRGIIECMMRWCTSLEGDGSELLFRRVRVPVASMFSREEAMTT